MTYSDRNASANWPPACRCRRWCWKPTRPTSRPAWAPDTRMPANLRRFAQVLAELRGEPLMR